MVKTLLQSLVSEKCINDENYRQRHIRIINPLPGTIVLGVLMPQMKQLAKQLSKRSDAIDILKMLETNASNLCFEEIMVWGLMINYMKLPIEERLDAVRKFVPSIDNWAVCDTFCCNAKWVRDRALLWDFLQPYWKSDKEFEVRFAVVLSMIYFLDDEWFPMVSANIDSLDLTHILSDYVSEKYGKNPGAPSDKGIAIGEPPYYVRMAVAWLLATALAKIPDMVRTYVRKSSLPKDVIKLYVRKSHESFRTRNVDAI